MEEQKKKCLSCGKEVIASVNFCPNCGKNDFRIVDENITMELSPEDNPFLKQNQVVTNVQSSSEKEPEKKNTGIKIVIIIIIIVLFSIVGKAIGMLSVSSSDNGSMNNSDYENEIAAIEYTVGEVSGDTYVNEWADIKITIPEGYSLATEEMYQSAAGNNSDCCLYIINNDGYNLIFNVEDVSIVPYVDEEMYADIYLENIEEGLQTDYASYATEFLVLNEGDEVEIAGHTYYRVACQIKMEVGDVSVAPIQSVYIRKIENRILAFAVATLTMEEAEEIMLSIASYN